MIMIDLFIYGPLLISESQSLEECSYGGEWRVKEIQLSSIHVFQTTMSVTPQKTSSTSAAETQPSTHDTLSSLN